jgi:hypothetical protein
MDNSNPYLYNMHYAGYSSRFGLGQCRWLPFWMWDLRAPTCGVSGQLYNVALAEAHAGNL